MEMGSCEDPGEVWHEAALGQDSIMGFVQSHDSELPFCLKADLELTGINVAPPEMQNGFGELLFGESAGCVSYDYTERAAANNKDCRVGECANVAVPILEKVLDDENGAVRDCLNESRVEISNCFLKKEGLCTEKAGLQGKHELVISIQTHETPVTHLKRDFFEAKEQKDANGVNGPSSKGLVEEKSDSLAVMESNTRDHLSVYREMPVEHQSMDGPSHCPEQDCLQDDKLVSCTSTKRIMKVIEEEHDALVGTETLCGDESVPPEGCEMPSDSMFADYSPKQHIQLDEHKCNKCMGSPHVDGFIWVSEERSGVLVGANSFSCKPILPSESAEVSTTCLATKSIQQGEQKDDKFIDCPFVEGAMEVKEVMIFNDQILPSYHCEILSESMPVTILSKNCDEENVLDTRIFRGLDSNTDVPYQIEAHSCNWISLPEGDEMHIKSLEGDLESSGWHDNQKSETGDSDPYTKTSAKDGWLGCGDQCLNRMLNIECVQGTCPCGDICSNQQFQKRQCAGMKWVRCGKKGFGLQLQEDISKGQFLIEYVGEVLDMHAYEARQREYAAKGHKHFYFMTLNGGEVIDACAKGNLGRFINHSCDPNCRTEKWMVNGEICIGLFAIRDIKKGEEVTFDYNYVRVFGAAVKKCYCGSLHCRGYIGGETHNAEVIVQGDSDEEFPEPVMLEDGKTGVHLKGMRRRTNSVDNDMKSVEVPVLKSDVTAEIGDAINLSASATSQPHSSPELEASKRNSLCSSQPVEVSPQTVSASKSTSHAKEAMPPENTLCSVQVLEKSFSVDVDASRKSKSETVKGKRVFSKSRFLIKTSHGSIKKGKVNGNLPNEDKVQMIANKPQVLSVRPKKLVEGSSDGRFEAVEEKLNELLDANGGISKRKEAPKGYLKLLLLTAASGGSGNGEAIQSNRDLSMILDALLKTKSRVVLVDIINKNGLRMLHNIMKQYRRDFKKIPILRKLLKVLEFLATREILAFDHINGGPPCPGMESFRESMLSLTEHDDKQVHQIARHFRDRWISKFVRKTNCLDRDDGGMEFHRGSGCVRVSGSHNNRHDDVVRSTKAIDCIMQSVPVTTSVDGTVQEGSSTGGCKTNDAKTRKRKSRWDQPAEPKTNMGSSVSPNTGVVDHLEEVSREDDSCLEYIHSQCQENEAICAANGGINSHEDVPPGFSSPLNPTMVSSSTSITPQSVGCLSCPLEVVVGNSQGKFISRLPMSYGIPLPIVQQIGSPDNETLGSWFIAPGMPFHPFPPLPPYPRDTKSTPHCAVKSMATNELPQQVRKDNLDNIGCYPHENNHGTSFRHQSEANFQVANVQQTCKRARGSSYDLSKKYYRQKKWNNVPPWLRRSMEWGYVGNNLGGGTCSVDVGNMTNESRSPYCTQDLNHGVEKAGCYYNPRLHHQNQH
ncbi:histone-lysine N-methyltransferase ASHH2 [Tripterygium wilfordii]|uniref:Histone-lysine N-methyltransferase ASHH2 n=1 Tax=Tripterygium wilfordii TaxID=458696 RepID=A0A7J7DSG1_TRIWF|nr:histone-lysine N-methyltransferase ASHH2 [Tripterygium wilfordii]